MEAASSGLANLAVTIACSCVLGIVILVLIYKMIDGDLPALQGLPATLGVFFLIGMSVKPVNPAIPGVVLVVALTCLALFPYAADQMEKHELRILQTERLIKAYDAFVQRPDNTAALFEIARGLYLHGMRANAIAITSAALNRLSMQNDPVKNVSLRDQFREEEYTLKKWMRTAQENPTDMRPAACPNCQTVNPPELIVCQKCGRPYVIDIAHDMNIKPKIFSRLVSAFALVAATIVGAASVGLYFQGPMSAAMVIVVIAVAGLTIQRLFKFRMPAM